MFEFVAGFSDGVDEDGCVGVGLDFVAQGGDEVVEAVLADETIIVPDGSENSIAGPHSRFFQHLRKCAMYVTF